MSTGIRTSRSRDGGAARWLDITPAWLGLLLETRSRAAGLGGPRRYDLTSYMRNHLNYRVIPPHAVTPLSSGYESLPGCWRGGSFLPGVLGAGLRVTHYTPLARRWRIHCSRGGVGTLPVGKRRKQGSVYGNDLSLQSILGTRNDSDGYDFQVPFYTY